MFNLLGRFSRFVLSLLLLSFLLGPAARASDWSDPEQQLAQKITAITGPGAVSLDLVNRSSLSQADIDGIRSTLRNQLSAAGLTLVNPDQAAATVQVVTCASLCRRR